MSDDLGWLDKLSKEGRVCASRAHNEYKVPDSVIRKLDVQLWSNPHYRSAAPMRMYLREDVLVAAVKFHTGKRAAEEERASRWKSPVDYRQLGMAWTAG